MKCQDHSIQILAIDQRTQKFYLTSEGRQFLLSLEGPLSIISIAGIYRSGKSYLINRFIKSNTGFQTGSSTKSVTKGLQAWSRPISAIDQQGKPFHYILIDSEGIGSIEQENQYDVKLLMILFLISSTVVYNSLGPIDETSLDQLNVVLKLNECVKGAEDAKPRFIWVLRDFSLQLIDDEGRQMSSNQYLQKCLQQTTSHNSQSHRKNQIRKGIKNNLSSLSCYTIVRPTVKQEDLADLSKCHLRVEFVEQVECLKQDIFGGGSKDIKIINGHKIDGKVLYLLLDKYVQTINNNNTPSVSQIWKSVADMATEQAIQQSCQQLNKQVNRIVLPISKEQLKYKINEIQNRIYAKLESKVVNNANISICYKKFIRAAQKINKEIKNTNQGLLRRQVIRKVTIFVKENIELDKIEPANLAIVKHYVDRMQLRSYGQIQAYEYILQVIYDLLHVIESKSRKIERQCSQMRQYIYKSSEQQKSSDMIIIGLKKDYHDALKTIANIQNEHSELDKNYELLKNQQESYQVRLREEVAENYKQHENYALKLQQTNTRWSIRLEEANQTIKLLRADNQQQLQQIQTNKNREIEFMMNDRKEIIFQQKIKDTWSKFDEERKYYQSQLHKCKKQTAEYKHKLETHQKELKQLQTKCHNQQIKFNNKQQILVTQMNDLKNLHAQSKKTYFETFQTLRDNDVIMKNIENMSTSKNTMKNSNIKSAITEPDYMKNYYEGQLVKERQEYTQKIKVLNEEINTLSASFKLQKHKAQQLQQQNTSWKEKYGNMQDELEKTNQKFIGTLSQIEAAKQKERSLYEQSIIRLLQNIDKRENQSSYCSRLQ